MYCKAPFEQPCTQLEDHLHWWKAREKDSSTSILSVSVINLLAPTIELTLHSDYCSKTFLSFPLQNV